MNITISSDNYQAGLQTLGAELKSFRSPDGKEFIWNSDPAVWMRSSPLLFPTIGNVRNNRTIIEGQEYPLVKHGFCKESEFMVEKQSEDEVTFLLTDSEETLKQYPYRFELRLTYKICKNRLIMIYQVTNKDDRTMYYHIGAHPGFTCPLEEGEAFTDYQLEFSKEERLEAAVYDLSTLQFFSEKKKLFAEKGRILPLNYDMFDDDAVYFPHTNSREVKMVNHATGKGVRMYYRDFCSIAFWTMAGKNAPYLCLEPWNGAAIFEDEDDIFSHKRDIQSLEAGKEACYRLEIELMGY